MQVIVVVGLVSMLILFFGDIGACGSAGRIIGFAVNPNRAHPIAAAFSAVVFQIITGTVISTGHTGNAVQLVRKKEIYNEFASQIFLMIFQR